MGFSHLFFPPRVSLRHYDNTMETKSDKQLRDFLYSAYWIEKKSMSDIAEEMEVAYDTVFYYFNKFKIKRRPMAKAVSIGQKKRWAKLKKEGWDVYGERCDRPDSKDEQG